MKILHLLGDRKLPLHLDDEGASGVVRAALEIARAQVGLGHEVSIASVGSEAWRSEWKGVQLGSLVMAPWARVRIDGRTLDFRRHLPYILLTRRQAFDIVHGHLYSYMRFLRAKRRVVHFHSDPFYKGRNNEKIDLKPADFVNIAQNTDAQVAVSRFIAGELERGLGNLGSIHVVHNGVDAAQFNPERWQEAGLRLRQEWGVPENGVVFLFAGAIVPEKGVIHLARAFSRLAANTSRLHLALVGASKLWGGELAEARSDNNYEAEVRQALREPMAAGQVHFLGKVASSKMPRVYAAGDVVVIPSVWREPFPLVALEAMAAGRPIIASRTGGLVELVNGQNGILVAPGEEAELESAIAVMGENPNLRQRLGGAARPQAQRFSWELAARQLDDIYGDISEKKA